MRVVKELYTRDSLTGTTLGVLASIMASLGFTNYIAPLEEEACRRLQPDHNLEFSFVKLLKSKSNKPIHKFMAIKEDPVIWQLRVFGEYMDRSMDSAPDPRVGFQPDAWQREVLDCLDNPKSSILVVGEGFLNVNIILVITDMSTQHQRALEKHSYLFTRWRRFFVNQTTESSYMLLRPRPW